MRNSLFSSVVIVSLGMLGHASTACATDFVFAPAPVTGELVEPGSDTGNGKFTFISVDAGNTSITGFGGSVAMRQRGQSALGMNLAGNALFMTDDTGNLTITTFNGMAGPDLYLGDNVIAFFDLSLGATNTSIDMGSTTTSSSSSSTGFSYGIQLNLTSGNGFTFTPYFMAIEQTVSTTTVDVDVSSSVVGFDILIDQMSLAAMFQSSDDTDIVMFSIGANF